MASQKTLLDLRTSVRYVLDEPTPSRWSNANLTSFISQAMHRVWNEVRRLRHDYFIVSMTSQDGIVTILGESYDTTSLRVTVGGTTMTLPPDFAELVLFEVITTNQETVRFTPLKLTSPYFRAARELTSNTAPDGLFFDIYGSRTLVYAPKSDTLLDTKLTYVYRVADLVNDSDPMTMPEPLDIAVVWYAAASAQLQDFAPEAAANETRARKLIEEMVAADSRQDLGPVIATSAWANYVDW